MELEAWARRVDGVTFVGSTVSNDAADPTRVRIASSDRPVWPPRRNGVPCTGWDDGGYEGVLAPGETRALGYATPARVGDDPVRVAWTEPAPEVHSTESGPDSQVGEEADPVRALGDPRPPRDAVPAPRVLPDAVAAWLDETTERVAAGEPAATDREALRRVAARVRAALRDGRNEDRSATLDATSAGDAGGREA